MPAPFVIRGASVLDGRGGTAVAADVRVDAEGRVSEIAPSISPSEGEDVVDGSGRALAPGFVDMHSHSDLYTVVRPAGAGAPIGDGPKLLQGCTTQVFGQDGISAAPVADGDVEDYAAYIAALDGFLEPARWTWRSFGQYLTALRAASTTRVAGLVGHSTVRRLVMGMEARPPTEDELSAMQAAVATAMDEGAIGLSSGLVYVPAVYASTDELVALNQVVAAKGGRFFVHVRSESERVVEATEEVLSVAERTGVHLHYSHIKTAGRSNWSKAGRLVELLDEYRAAGGTVTSDVHPYTAGSTTAAVLVPPWAQAGGRDETLSRLRDPAARERIRAQCLSDSTSWDNWYAFSEGWEGLHIAWARRAGVTGRSFADVIRSAGVSDLTSAAAFDVVFDLLVEEQLAVSLISHNNIEENVARFIAQPHCAVGSDALVNPDGHPHPRLYGTFPRVLGRYVRELGALGLEEAVAKMTARAAEAIGWAGAGRIEVGAPADLVLFDPEGVTDRATYEEPRLPPEGIERVWVGGHPAVVGGALAADVPAAES